MTDYTLIGVTIACAVFWYRGAVFENVPAWRWVLPSLLVSTLAPLLTKGSWGWALLGNAAMLVAITLWRVYQDERDAKR